jgi:hypothetical protein
MHINPTIARGFLLILACVVGIPAGADQRGGPWTAHDSDTVADAAVATTSDDESKLNATSALMELTDALIRAGNLPKAKQVVEGAVANLGSSEPQNSYLRGQMVEKLILLGDARAAEALAAAAVTQSVKITLFGKFGVERARAGNIGDAQRAANTINSLPRDPTIVPADASARALADISVALAESGALAEASKMVMPLPDGLPKVQALSQVARVACKKDNSQTNAKRRGRTSLEQATGAARAAIAAADRPFLKINVAVAAGEAIASCNGPDGARSFIDETLAVELRDRAVGGLVDRLTQQNEFAAARLLLSSANPTDARGLVDKARRLMKLGDRAKATELAVTATRSVSDISSRPKPGGYDDNVVQLGQIISLLIQVGAYDEAIAVAQGTSTDSRLQYYVSAVDAALRNSDAASVGRLLPVSLALKVDSSFNNGSQFRSLSDLTRMLAVAGYRDQALQRFAELQELMTKAPPNVRLGQGVTSLAAVLQADGGDIAGALEAADRAGPMVTKPDRLAISMFAAMTLGNKRPMEAEIMEAIRQAEMLMPLVAGPKAEVLSDIAMHMAAKGDIAAALTAAAILEEEQNDVVNLAHDTAVQAIADAQIKAGDLRGAFATALRIRRSTSRRTPLLKLAASPITH